ncbi:MAG: hypothetical protein Q9M40_05745 [Sulfurimonas sp.]|nr:hypothetical protein [Sulfurimonas sp.]
MDLTTLELTENDQVYIFGTDETAPNNYNSGYKLSGSTWVKDELVTAASFSISSDSKILNVPFYNAEVILLSSEDLSGKTRYIDFLDKNVTFSTGAKANMNAFRVSKDSFLELMKSKEIGLHRMKPISLL